MTRGQRRTHAAIWLVVAIVLGASAAHALFVERARWRGNEAIEDGR